MSNRQETSSGPVAARPIALVAGLVVLALVFGLAMLRWSPPSPKPEDAPPDQFSAGRAMAVLGELLAEGRTHPVGTETNDRVRERIVGRLESLGYAVEIQDTVACRTWRTGTNCAPVRNVVTRLPGETGGPAVLLMAHYDSVGVGAGAADDTSSVAEILEIARILVAEAPHHSPIILLFTEGEEVGLLGARAFVDEHPWAQDVGVVINLEARGTAGQSLMFETSDDNAWLIDVLAAEVPRPSANSLSYEIYKMLPNDTDLTIFKQAGIPGLNFSFIDRSAHYHTDLDRIENLDPRSVQHQGESVLALARALAARDLANPPAGNAAYLDIWGLVVVHWPAAWSLPLALATVLVLVVVAVVAVRRRSVTVGGLLLGLLGGLLSLILPVLLGLGLVALIARLGQGSLPWYAYPLPTRLALWAGALLCGGLVAALLGRRAGLWGLGLGAWLLWAILAVILSVTITGVAIILLVPAMLAAVLLAIVVLSGRHGSANTREAALLAAMAFAGFIFLPFALMFEVATRFDMSPAITVALGLAVATLVPLLALPRGQTRPRTILIAASAVVMLGGVVAALLVPPYSPSHPQPVNIYHVADADAGQARWVSVPAGDTTPASLREQFEAEAVTVFPWSDAMYLTAKAEANGGAAPTLDVVSSAATGETRTVTLRLRSPRSADSIQIVLPVNRLDAIAVEGRPLDMPGADSTAGSFFLTCYGLRCDGLAITLQVAGAEPVAAWLADSSLGLPAGADVLLQARPATAVPYQQGDLTTIVRRVEF